MENIETQTKLFKEAPIETLKKIKPEVLSALKRGNLPKGYAKRLACNYVLFMTGAINMQQSFFERSRDITREGLINNYREIQTVLSEVKNHEKRN